MSLGPRPHTLPHMSLRRCLIVVDLYGSGQYHLVAATARGYIAVFSHNSRDPVHTFNEGRLGMPRARTAPGPGAGPAAARLSGHRDIPEPVP